VTAIGDRSLVCQLLGPNGRVQMLAFGGVVALFSYKTVTCLIPQDFGLSWPPRWLNELMLTKLLCCYTMQMWRSALGRSSTIERQLLAVPQRDRSFPLKSPRWSKRGIRPPLFALWNIRNMVRHYATILIIGFCILLRVILIVNNNTFCFATIDKVFY
jgi:hypothetical protein